MHRIAESLCCVPEINVTLCVDYTNNKNKKTIYILKHWIDIFGIWYMDFSGFFFSDPIGQNKKFSYYVISIFL